MIKEPAAEVVSLPEAAKSKHDLYLEGAKNRVTKAIKDAIKELRDQRAAAISAGKKPTRIFRSTVLRTAKVDKNTLKEKYHSSSEADVSAFVTEMNGTADKMKSSEIKAAERLPRDETKFLRDRNQALEQATFALEARIRFLESQVRRFKAQPLDEISISNGDR